ncbi:hypothetical protein Q9233_014850 [Columba guinea]|nr:hypothetical protein Q9233_014850 [Columba guinea]
MEKQAVHEIINQALEKLEEMQVPMPDYALKSAGAAIILSKTSPSLRTAKAKVFLYSLPVMDYMRSPELILEGSKEEHKEQGTFLGQFNFLATRNPSQTFQLKDAVSRMLYPECCILDAVSEMWYLRFRIWDAVSNMMYPGWCIRDAVSRMPYLRCFIWDADVVSRMLHSECCILGAVSDMQDLGFRIWDVVSNMMYPGCSRMLYLGYCISDAVSGFPYLGCCIRDAVSEMMYPRC